jgi:hypothetical protein
MATKNRDAVIITAISGEMACDAPMSIESGYFEREASENLREQGFNPEDFGLPAREKTYGGAKEHQIRQALRDVEECEAKRVNRDPFADTHNQEEKEDYMSLVQPRTALNFIESQKVDLDKAKLRRTYGQFFEGNDLVSESITIELWNKDLEERFIIKIGSKKAITHSFPIHRMGEQPSITVEKGSFSIVRNKDRNAVTMIISGKKDVTMTFKTEGLIWMALVVDKKEVAPEEVDIAL